MVKKPNPKGNRNKKAAQKLAENVPRLSRKARVRLAELLEEFEPTELVRGSILHQMHGRHGPRVETFGEAAPRLMRSKFGQEIELDPLRLKQFCLEAEVFEILGVLMSAATYLRELEGRLFVTTGVSQSFVDEVNEIVEADEFHLFLEWDEMRWQQRIESDLELLRRALLVNADDVAACRQGDPQVEMVVSSVQPLLARPDPVIVDYSCGLGRVLVGFGSAERFRNATYIAVDEPVDTNVRSLANTVGARFVERTRSRFLEQPDPADVIILMNTLHHIPLRDIPRQLAVLLGALKPHGVLIIQEIGELREPEQVNVPWVIEDIIELFAISGCVTNPRSTTTRNTKTPLTHMLVHLDGEPPSEDAFRERVRTLWKKMKRRTVDDLRRLYTSRNDDDQRRLHYALIANANLDLNEPPA